MNKNFKKIKLVYMMIVVTFIFVPFFAFVGIIYNDNDLTQFFTIRNLPWMTDDLFNQFTNLKYMPTNDLYTYAIASIVLFFFALLLMVSLFFNFKIDNDIKYQKFSQIRFAVTFFSIIVTLVLSAGLLGYSQYYFGWFNEWVKSLMGNASDAESIKQYIHTSLTFWGNLPNDSHQSELTEALFQVVVKSDGGFGPSYDWVGLDYIWLVVSFQILIIVGAVLRTGFNIIFSIESTFERKYEDLIVKKESFNIVFIRRFIQKRLVPNEKNISIGIALTTLLTFLPQIIYIIIIDAGNTLEHQFTNYSYVYPYLFHNMYIFNGVISNNDIVLYYDYFQNCPGNLLTVSKIPLFGIFVVLAFVWIFIYVYIKKHSISQISFVVFFGVFVLIEIIALSLMAISQSMVISGVHFWNNSKISHLIPIIFHQDSINYLWLKSNELISALFLSFAFLIIFSIMEFSQIIKLKRRNVTKTNQLANMLD